MTVSDFYRNSCKEKLYYTSLQNNPKKLIVAQGIFQMCNELYEKQGRTAIVEHLQSFFSASFEAEWFSYSWEREQEITDWLAKRK